MEVKTSLFWILVVLCALALANFILMILLVIFIPNAIENINMKALGLGLSEGLVTSLVENEDELEKPVNMVMSGIQNVLSIFKKKV